MSHGLVVGKFLPPHAGHHLVVDRALAACDRVTVAVPATRAEPIAPALRSEWLPTARCSRPAWERAA